MCSAVPRPDQQAEYSYKKELYERYVAERVAADNIALELGDRYEKLQSLVAGGALAVSVTFLEKIAPHPVAWSRCLAFIGWAALCVSLAATLRAIQFGERAMQRKVESIDADIERRLNNEAPEQTENPFPPKVARYNIVSFWATITGIGCLVIFASVNLPTPSNDTAKTTDQSSTATTTAQTGGNVPDKQLRSIGEPSPATTASAKTQSEVTMPPPPKPSPASPPPKPVAPTQESHGSYIPSKNQVPPPPPPNVTPANPPAQPPSTSN